GERPQVWNGPAERRAGRVGEERGSGRARSIPARGRSRWFPRASQTPGNRHDVRRAAGVTRKGVVPLFVRRVVRKGVRPLFSNARRAVPTLSTRTRAHHLRSARAPALRPADAPFH